MSLTMKTISKENHFLGSQGHPFRISDHCLDFSSWTSQEQSALALPQWTCSLLCRTGCILCTRSQLRGSAQLMRYSQLKPPTLHHRHLQCLLNRPFLSNFYAGSGSPLPNCLIIFGNLCFNHKEHAMLWRACYFLYTDLQSSIPSAFLFFLYSLSDKRNIPQ